VEEFEYFTVRVLSLQSPGKEEREIMHIQSLLNSELPQRSVQLHHRGQWDLHHSPGVHSQEWTGIR